MNLDDKFRRVAEIQKQMKKLEGELSTLFTPLAGADVFPKQVSSSGKSAGKKSRGRKKGSKMSAAARARIGAAQRERWAKLKAGGKAKKAKG
jgi:hypothetical protein